MLRPATPGTILTLVAAILLVLVTVSTPIVKSIYFLQATIGGRGSQHGQTARFGTLGYCIGNTCSSPTLGYSFDPNQLLNIQVVSGKYTSTVIKGLTYTLVLTPIALAFSVIAVLLGLISHCREFSTNCFGTFVTGIAAFITLVAFGLDLALFIIAKKRINSIDGASAELGMALWMTLAAWILLFLAGCAFSCGICSRRRHNRVNDSHIPDSYGARPAAPMQDRYGEQMRMDALDAEADRKRRQASLAKTRRDDLPKFAEYETEYEVPLKNDYDDANYETHYQPGLAYSTNSNVAHTGLAGAAAGAGGSVINGVGQGYGRRQAQRSHAEDFSSSPPILNNSAGHGAHNLQAQRQNTVSSVGGGHGMPQPSVVSSHTEALYVPGVGPQPYRDGMDSQMHGSSSLMPAPRPFPQVSSPPPMTDYSHHNQYPSSHSQPHYDAYGNTVPSAAAVDGSHFSQPGGARRQPTGEYGHPTEYSGATFGPPSSGFLPPSNDPAAASANGGSRMRGPRDLPVIPQNTGAEPQEIVYDGGSAPVDRRQGTIDDGFGLASVLHGPQQQHDTTHETGYDQYASSAYGHPSQQEESQYHGHQPSVGAPNQYQETRPEASSSAAGHGYHHAGGSQYEDYQSSAGPPGYESIAAGSGQYQHNPYSHEKM